MIFRRSSASTTLQLLAGAVALSALAPQPAHGASYPTPFVHPDGVNAVVYRAGYTWEYPDGIWALSVTGTGIAFQATDLSSMPPFAPHANGWFAAYGRSDGVTSVVYTGLFDKRSTL